MAMAIISKYAEKAEEALGTVGGKAGAAVCGWPFGPPRVPTLLPRGEERAGCW